MSPPVSLFEVSLLLFLSLLTLPLSACGGRLCLPLPRGGDANLALHTLQPVRRQLLLLSFPFLPHPPLDVM